MVFSSIIFIFYFFPIVLLGYYALPRSLKNTWLLISSLVFFIWGEPASFWVIIASAVANYFFAFPIGSGVLWRRKLALALGIVVNLGLLCSYKYAGFVVENWNKFSELWGASAIPLPQGHLPMGISFFTFQAVSYLIDVYRGLTPPEKRLDRFALYLTLFPHLVAGPIVRYVDLAKELVGRKESWSEAAAGMQRFIIGLGKKVLIANPLSIMVDEQFGIPSSEMTTGIAWLATAAYGLQIYFDFSAYSDMAIGIARMFGFHFKENFNHPYSALSVQDFWRRWHISLSTWFRDYLYIPLGGNRVSMPRQYFNLMTVFLLCGLWHGASWNFVVWGAWHGLFLILERVWLKALLDKLWAPLRWCYTVVIVLIGWVFFRAVSMEQALNHLACMAGFGAENSLYTARYYFDNLNIITLIAGFILCFPIAAYFKQRWNTFVEGNGRYTSFLNSTQSFVCLLALVLLFVLCAAHLTAITYSPFIYFRF